MRDGLRGLRLALALVLLGAGAPAHGAGPPAGAAPTARPADTPLADEAADTPLARLGDALITWEDVAPDVAFRIYRLRVDIHSLLQQETERLVEERLLAREAARRGTTPEALVEEAMAAAEPVDEDDVDAWLAAHPGEGQGPPEQVRARVRHFLQERRRIEMRLALLERLREEADYAWLLEPPEPPRIRLAIGDAPTRGPEDAPVTVVHFASFGSEASARSARKLARLRDELPGRVRVVHRNFLRPRDEGGLRAAQLGVLAAERGRFWTFHDAVFDRDGPLDPDALAAAARAAGLAPHALSEADPDPLLRRVKDDQDAGTRAGVPREPTLFVNGRYVSGFTPYEELRAIVREELRRAEAGTTAEAPGRDG